MTTITRRDIIFGSVGAFGGAGLKLVADLVLEGYKADEERERDRLQREQAERDKLMAQLHALAAGFDDLGDIPRRAVELIENGREGTTDDVRTMKRHFDRVIRVATVQGTDGAQVVRYYGGRIAAWSQRFSSLADGSSKAARRFGDYERYNFGVAGRALGYLAIAGRAGRQDPGAMEAAASEMENVSGAMGSEGIEEGMANAMELSNAM
jgi:hypothetical protein